MSQELIAAVGKRMIQRKDVKARQIADGSYFPVRDRQTSANVPFTLADLNNHFAGTETYGHYLLDANDQCKFFAFDVDLEKTGKWVNTLDAWKPDDEPLTVHEFNPREAWRDRQHLARPFLKQQMRTIAGLLAGKITQLLQIPCAAAYTGNKGIHVYGFTGVCPAAEAREGARLVLEALGDWEPSRGKAFWVNTNDDPQFGFKNFSLEVFPKQDSLDGKDLGNLMRLPLGVNLKAPKDPTFFIDLTTDLATLAPHRNPVALLESGDPWS